MADRRIPITGYTELFGVIATPIKHSSSPALHNAAFEELGMDDVYLAFEVDPEGLEEAVEGLKAMHVRGWNVSMPHKNTIMKYMDHISPVSQLCEAVNTVINDDGVLTGTSTDGIGWKMSLREAGVDIRGKKLVMLGAGGAATAIIAQAAIDKVASIDVFNLKDKFWDRAINLCNRIEEATSVPIRLHDLSDHELLHETIMKSDIVTNATSVGMKPHEDTCLLNDDDFREGLVVSDCVYNPRETLLLKKAKAHNCIVSEGIYMIVYQGAESFRLWTGKDMPIEAVKKKMGL